MCVCVCDFRVVSCIDEFGCIRDHDRSTIHEAMEQQTVSVSKAGIVCTLNTRTTVFGAMNPKGSYDPDADMSVNTSLASPLLSRFDLVLLMLDRRQPDWDEQVVGYIMDGLEKPLEEEVIPMSRQDFESEVAMRREIQMTQAPTQRTSSTGSHANATAATRNRVWELERLQAYIQYVKHNFFPTLTPLAQRILTRYYQYQRAADSRSAARTTIRLLESLIRLTQAHARLMFRPHACAQDALMAIAVMDSSLQTCGVASSYGSAGSGGLLGLSSLFSMDHEALTRPDQLFESQLRHLLLRLDLHPTESEWHQESQVCAAIESSLLDAGITEAAIRQRQQEQERVEQQLRQEAIRRHDEMLTAAMSNQPLPTHAHAPDHAASNVRDTNIVSIAPSLFATTPNMSVHTLHVPIVKPIARQPTAHVQLTQKTSVSPSATTGKSNLFPPQNGGVAQQASLPSSSSSSSSNVYDPFATLQVRAQPVPAYKPNNDDTGEPSSRKRRHDDGAGLQSPSPSSSTPTSASPVPSRLTTSRPASPSSATHRPPKRARLGATRRSNPSLVSSEKNHPNATTIEDEDAEEDDSDEDQSVLLLSQIGPSKRQIKRNAEMVTVKREPEDEPLLASVHSRDRSSHTNSVAPIAASSSSNVAAHMHASPSANPLDQLVASGVSLSIAQSILTNPLRTAAVAAAQQSTPTPSTLSSTTPPSSLPKSSLQPPPLPSSTPAKNLPKPPVPSKPPQLPSAASLTGSSRDAKEKTKPQGESSLISNHTASSASRPNGIVDNTATRARVPQHRPQQQPLAASLTPSTIATSTLPPPKPTSVFLPDSLPTSGNASNNRNGVTPPTSMTSVSSATPSTASNTVAVTPASTVNKSPSTPSSSSASSSSSSSSPSIPPPPRTVVTRPLSVLAIQPTRKRAPTLPSTMATKSQSSSSNQSADSNNSIVSNSSVASVTVADSIAIATGPPESGNISLSNGNSSSSTAMADVTHSVASAPALSKPISLPVRSAIPLSLMPSMNRVSIPVSLPKSLPRYLPHPTPPLPSSIAHLASSLTAAMTPSFIPSAPSSFEPASDSFTPNVITESPSDAPGSELLKLLESSPY